MSETVFLVGFMGSGKTTIGKKLATKLSYTFVDLDLAIEQREGDYIRDIIEQKGESYFRRSESETLKLLDLSQKVIATGGGTPCFFDNMQWMKTHGTVVFLNLSGAAIFSRLKTTDLKSRPLLKGLDDDGLKSFIQTKLSERLPFYTQADMEFDALKDNMDELAKTIGALPKSDI